MGKREKQNLDLTVLGERELKTKERPKGLREGGREESETGQIQQEDLDKTTELVQPGEPAHGIPLPPAHRVLGDPSGISPAIAP